MDSPSARPEQAAAEAELLREREERLRLAVLTAELAMWDWDLATGRVVWSDEHYTMQGYRPGERPPSHEAWLERVHPEDRAGAMAEFARARAARDHFVCDYRSVHPDGTVRWLAARGRFYYDGAGEPVRMLGVVRDVTDRQQAENARSHAETMRASAEVELREALAQAKEARALAEQANQAKDDFLATLSHELRTPLAAILLWARALRVESVPEALRARALDAITESATSQSRLIDELLDLARLTSGKLTLAFADVDVATIVRSSLDVVAPSAQAKQVRLELQLEGELGVSCVDPERLKQVLWNLLSNAIKFTPEGGHVLLSVERDAGTLRCRVVDTGQGMEPAVLARAFERFWQADVKLGAVRAGLGLGLALTKQLVELMGGTIAARSEGRGKGSTFELVLPWRDPEGESVEHDSRPSLEHSLVGSSILLVEDDDNTSAGMQSVLRGAGAHVVAVTSLAAALTAWQREPGLTIVVSDIDLPDGSGLSLLRSMAESSDRDVAPACAVSAHAGRADKQAAIEAGFDIHLAKPFTPEQLVEAVAMLAELAVTPSSGRDVDVERSS